MHNVPRIVGTAAVAVCSLLCGCQLSPLVVPAKKPPAVERYEAAREIEKYATDARNAGSDAPWGDAAAVETRVLWSKRLAETTIETGALAAHDAYGQHVARMELMLQETQLLHENGRKGAIEVEALRFHVADAKLQLERTTNSRTWLP